MRPEGRVRACGESALILLIASLPVLRFGGWIVDDTAVGLTRAPLRQLHLWSQAWSYSNLGYDQTTSQAYLFPVNVAFILLRAVQIPPEYANQTWMGLLLLTAGFGMRWFIRTWLPSRYSAVSMMATFGYMLSSYVIVIISDTSMFLIAYALLPWSMAIALRTVQGRMGALRAIPLLALTFLMTSSVDITLLLINVVATTGFTLGIAVTRRDGEARLRPIATVVAGVCCGMLLLSFGLFPAVYSAAVDSGAVRANLAAETTAMYDANTSLHEVARLQGYWALYSGYAGRPYHPNADYYLEDWLGARIGYGVLALAILGLVTRRKDRVALTLGGVALVSMRLVIGTHPTQFPPGSTWVASWLFQHVPVSSIFRDTFKFMSVMTFAVVALMASSIDALLFSRTFRAAKCCGLAIVFVVVGLNAEPAWAQMLWWPDRGTQLLPADWFRAAQWLNSQTQADDGGVLYAPDMPSPVYAWGKPPDPPGDILIERPQAYLAPGTRTVAGDRFLRRIYSALDQTSPGDDALLVRLLQQARLRYVLVARDVRSRYYPNVMSPYIADDKLAAAPDFRLVWRLSDLSIYRLDEAIPPRVTVSSGLASPEGDSVMFSPSGLGGTVHLASHARPVTVILREAYHAGWTAQVGATARALQHEVAVGYANGWTVPPGVTDVAISYRPAAIVALSRILSAAALFVVISLLAVSRVVRINSEPATER